MEGILTKVDSPNIFFPKGVNSIGVTLTSHPFSLLPTVAPSALPSIWCPKHIPTILTLFCSNMLLTKSTNFKIHGSLSKLLCLDPLIRIASMSSKFGYACAFTTSKTLRSRSEGESGGEVKEVAECRREVKTPP